MWGIKVKVWNPNAQDYAWFWLHPTGGNRYEFDSRESAQNDYPADVRMAWCDFVESTRRSGEIADDLCERATL